MEEPKSFYSKWSPSPKVKSLLAERAERDQPLFLRGLPPSPKAGRPAKEAKPAPPARGGEPRAWDVVGPPTPKVGKPGKEAEPAKRAPPAKGKEPRAWDHAEPKRIIRTFTY